MAYTRAVALIELVQSKNDDITECCWTVFTLNRDRNSKRLHSYSKTYQKAVEIPNQWLCARCDLDGSESSLNTVPDDGRKFSNLLLPRSTVGLETKLDRNSHIVLWDSTNALQLHAVGIAATEEKHNLSMLLHTSGRWLISNVCL